MAKTDWEEYGYDPKRLKTKTAWVPGLWKSNYIVLQGLFLRKTKILKRE